MDGLTNGFSFRSTSSSLKQSNTVNDLSLAQKRIMTLEAEVQSGRDATTKLDLAEKRIQKLEDEAQKSRVAAAKLNLELSEVKKQVKGYTAKAREVKEEEKDALEAQLVGKIAELERLLDVTGLSGLVKMVKTFNHVVRATGEHLGSGLRTFHHAKEDVKAARNALTPLLDDEILDLVANISEQNPAKPSSALVKVVSQALFDQLCCKLSLFQLAGWTLATPGSSRIFESILQRVAQADEDFEGRLSGLIRKKEFSFYVSYHSKVFEGDEMQALDIIGNPLLGVLDGEASALRPTLKKGQSRPHIGGLLGFRSGYPSSQSSAVEKQLSAAQLEVKKMEDQLKETQGIVSKLNEELSKTKAESQTLTKQVRDIKKENDRLELLVGATSVSADATELVDRVAKLEYLLEVTGISAFISKMKAFNNAVLEIAEFLDRCLLFKPADVFEDELKEARSDLRSLIGDTLVNFLRSQAKKEPAKPLSTLVLIVSRTLLINLAAVCRKERAKKPESDGLTKRLVLKRFTSMFKVASWSLASSEDRSAFEDVLEKIFKADRDLDVATIGILRNNEFSMSLCGSGKVFAPDDMEALDARGLVLGSSSLSEDEEVVCTVGLGLTSRLPDRKGISKVRAVMPVQVILKSTLFRVMDCEGEGKVSNTVANSNARLDGRS
ncbi:hypothetical protein CPB83DRAFT_896054 [Crepidotus variabilis]|uniref:Uncharacterized protein n=1 Tax=Crepidotus variabilis TaxID=179855 RepID=A0A9P6JN77_9AGAR|nr:hypothetical protein CPB83DRAFT_896054 [Crepidotus variabilis]